MIPSNTISWCSSMTQFSSSSGNCVACRTTLLLAMHDPSCVSTLRFLATGYCLQCLGRHLREMKVVLTLSQQTPLVGCMIAPLRWFYSPWRLAARTVHWSARLLWHTLDCQLPRWLQYEEGIFDCGVKYGKGLSDTVVNVSLQVTNDFFCCCHLDCSFGRRTQPSGWVLRANELSYAEDRWSFLLLFVMPSWQLL